MTTAAISPSFLLISAPKFLFGSTSKLADPTLSLPSSALPRPLRYRWGRILERVSPERSQLWRVSAASGDAFSSVDAIEKAQQIPPAAAEDGTVSTVISVLLFVAFIGLSILTVIYLAVQDFLQKREREKFEKEEAAKKEKSGKKGKVKARAGPRGFGQKIEEDDD